MRINCTVCGDTATRYVLGYLTAPWGATTETHRKMKKFDYFARCNHCFNRSHWAYVTLPKNNLTAFPILLELENGKD